MRTGIHFARKRYGEPFIFIKLRPNIPKGARFSGMNAVSGPKKTVFFGHVSTTFTFD